MWIPIPPTNERQTIKLLNGADLSGGRFTKDKTFGNELYYQRFDVGDSKAPVTVELVYDVEVREATVPAAKQLISTTAAVPAGEFEPYLRETTMIPIKGQITELAKTIKLPDGEPLHRPCDLRLPSQHDGLQLSRTRHGKGNAVWACDSKTGDCTDFHSVFIGVCRWRGIPADHVFGLPLPPESPEGDAKYCHCWAQFSGQGCGLDSDRRLASQ